MRTAGQRAYPPHPRSWAGKLDGSFHRDREPRQITHATSVEVSLSIPLYQAHTWPGASLAPGQVQS